MFQIDKCASAQDNITALTIHLTEKLLGSYEPQVAFLTVTDDSVRKALVDGCRATAEALLAPKPAEPTVPEPTVQVEDDGTVTITNEYGSIAIRQDGLTFNVKDMGVLRISGLKIEVLPPAAAK